MKRLDSFVISSQAVSETYKKHIDRTLFRVTLGLTPEQRLRDLMRLQRFAEELRRAGRKALHDRP